MIRRAFAGLLTALLAAPSFGARVEAVRLESPTALVSAPGAFVGAALAPQTLFATSAPLPLSAPTPFAAAPSAAPTPAPAALSAAIPAAYAPEPARDHSAAASARGPPAALFSARSSEGVSARVAETAGSWNVPVEDVFQNHDVLLVGEDHSSLTTIETLAREMPRLAKAGVTAVGIEGLKRPQQGAVDDYVLRHTETMPAEALGFSPARKAAFETLLTAARDNGVRVVALGLPFNEWAAQVAALAAKKAIDPIEEFGADFAAQVDRAESRYEYGFNEALVEVLLTRRNETMAKFLWNALGRKGKGVIVAGQAHVPGPDEISASRFHVKGDYGDLARELGTLALRSYSLTFTGGLFTSASGAYDDSEVRPEAHKAAAEASPDGAPAFVPLGPDRGLWHAGGRVSSVLTH